MYVDRATLGTARRVVLGFLVRDLSTATADREAAWTESQRERLDGTIEALLRAIGSTIQALAFPVSLTSGEAYQMAISLRPERDDPSCMVDQIEVAIEERYANGQTARIQVV